MPRKPSLPHPVFYKIKEFIIPFLNKCNVIDRAIIGCKDGGECEKLKELKKDNEDEFNKKALEDIKKALSPSIIWFYANRVPQYCRPDGYIYNIYFNNEEHYATTEKKHKNIKFKNFDEYKNILIEKYPENKWFYEKAKINVDNQKYSNETDYTEYVKTNEEFNKSIDDTKAAFDNFKKDIYRNNLKKEDKEKLIYNIAKNYIQHEFSLHEYLDAAKYLRDMIAIASNSFYDKDYKKIKDYDNPELVEWIKNNIGIDYKLIKSWGLKNGKFNADAKLNYDNGSLLDENLLKLLNGLFVKWIICYYDSSFETDKIFIANPQEKKIYNRTNNFHVCKACKNVFVGKQSSECCSNKCRQRISRKVNRF